MVLCKFKTSMLHSEFQVTLGYIMRPYLNKRVMMRLTKAMTEHILQAKQYVALPVCFYSSKSHNNPSIMYNIIVPILQIRKLRLR